MTDPKFKIVSVEKISETQYAWEIVTPCGKSYYGGIIFPTGPHGSAECEWQDDEVPKWHAGAEDYIFGTVEDMLFDEIEKIRDSSRGVLQ